MKMLSNTLCSIQSISYRKCYQIHYVDIISYRYKNVIKYIIFDTVDIISIYVIKYIHHIRYSRYHIYIDIIKCYQIHYVRYSRYHIISLSNTYIRYSRYHIDINMLSNTLYSIQSISYLYENVIKYIMFDTVDIISI